MSFLESKTLIHADKVNFSIISERVRFWCLEEADNLSQLLWILLVFTLNSQMLCHILRTRRNIDYKVCSTVCYGKAWAMFWLIQILSMITKDGTKSHTVQAFQLKRFLLLTFKLKLLYQVFLVSLYDKSISCLWNLGESDRHLIPDLCSPLTYYTLLISQILSRRTLVSNS